MSHLSTDESGDAEKKPFIEFFKHGLKTEAFEDYIKSIREPLEQHGIKTDVYTTRVPSPLMCLWTKGQRSRLLKLAKDYEAVVVLGCNSATDTVKEALKDADCQVFQAMRMKGIANAAMKFQFPMNINLEKNPLRKKRKVCRQKNLVGAAKESEAAERKHGVGLDFPADHEH